MVKNPDPRDRETWRNKLRGSDDLDALARLAETEAARQAIEDLRVERDVAERDVAEGDEVNP